MSAIRIAPLLLALAACSESVIVSVRTIAPDGPYVVVLGTAQDGGLPQIGCRQDCCNRARAMLTERRLATSLLVVDPRSKRRWLVDAGPDLREQVERARNRPPRGVPAGRPPLFDGVFLTHAHIGHYVGLAHLGREAYGAQGQRVWATAAMAEFLSSNGPWDQLVELGHIALEPLVPDEPVALAADLFITPFLVPHRHEYSDTVGFRIEGPERSLLFIPDIDKWERWDRSIEAEVADVDYALLDGTFFADGEIPGRAMADIPHPFIRETLGRFRGYPAAERAKVRFIHLNHTNPAAMPVGEARREIMAAGMAVAREGEVIGL